MKESWCEMKEGLSDFYTPKSKRTMFPDENPYVSV